MKIIGVEIIDLVAIIGAGAWLPYLIKMYNQWRTKPEVRVITKRDAEIGFNALGPIFNVDLAFAVKHRDIVVSDLRMILKHEEGEEKVFECQGITQQLLTMTTPDSGAMPFEKNQSVLAIKLNQKEVEERLIRFQEASFIATKQEHVLKVGEKIAHLTTDDGTYNAENLLSTQEMKKLYTFNEQAFPWKKGKYTVTIKFNSPEKFELVDNVMEFSLLSLDIEGLVRNKDFIKLYYRRIFVGLAKDDKEIPWQWRYPALKKLNKRVN